MGALQEERVVDLSDAFREAVEVAQAEFAKACAPGGSIEAKRAAALALEHAVTRLNDYILRYIVPIDVSTR